MRQILAILLLALPLFAQVPEGDRHYDRRGEGAVGARARTEPIDSAIAAFQRAIKANPNDLEAHWKLLRAYRYKGAYVAANVEEKKRVYGQAKTAGEHALSAVKRRFGGLVDVDKAKPTEVAQAARKISGSAEIFLWDSINWGEWALAYGKLAAARQGAADHILRGATIAMLADPRIEGGAPARVLGRLHEQTPRIPLITGWASKREAVRLLKESLAIDPSNKLTMVFLAEALVAYNTASRPEAVRLLRGVIDTAPDPLYPVEDAGAIEDARALLAKLER